MRLRDRYAEDFANGLLPQSFCAGREEPEVRQRADAIGRDLDELRRNALAGSPDEIVDKMEPVLR